MLNVLVLILACQNIFKFPWIEPVELLITYHNKGYTPTAHLEKLFLYLAGFADVEIQERNVIIFQPTFRMLAVRAVLSGVDYDFCRSFGIALHAVIQGSLVWVAREATEELGED